ncbi:MAG: ABC transporter ATP-binding protein [Firmicutes bacterium]|nr:ABC transporter ATP-binding protein [Bacillota bacterium]
MLEARGVTKSYQMGESVVHALRGIDLAVEAGEYVAIMGPSGSGKSTLMHILGCLDRPTSGALFIKGVDTKTLKDNALAETRNSEIGFVFQDFYLLPRLTVLENVEIPLVYAGVPRAERRARATRVLSQVGLQNRLGHKPSELSGGQRQRVAIARALVNEPSIILADEPTGNLDSVTGSEIRAIFSELNAAGNTIIMVTHEREVALDAQRIIHLKDGLVEKVEAVAV